MTAVKFPKRRAKPKSSRKRSVFDPIRCTAFQEDGRWFWFEEPEGFVPGTRS
jgi:hypothetical protein